MASFSVNDAEKYGGQGGGGFFSLKNDMDTARIKILYRDIDDVQGMSVHKVPVGDKERYVNCLREYGDPVDVCPFCAAKKFTQAKYFVPIYNLDEDRAQTWERGKTFGAKISSLCAHYPNLFTHTFDVERHGKAKDTQTFYEFFEVGHADENDSLENYEMPQILGGIVLDKTAEEMRYYIDRGQFPDDNNNQSEPISRGRREADDEPVSRRRPMDSNSRRESY